jgi:hypothetical protein
LPRDLLRSNEVETRESDLAALRADVVGGGITAGVAPLVMDGRRKSVERVDAEVVVPRPAVRPD